MKVMRKALSVLIVLLLTMGTAIPAIAADKAALQSNVDGTAAYIYKIVANPQVESVGGEWAIIGLARSGYDVPDTYYQNYYATVEAYVKECKGVLDERKYTEYSRVIVALTSIGKDPANVAGYNLLTPLGDFDKTILQGLNGPIWALIALNSGSYTMPKNVEAKTQATRQMYVDEILSRQLKNGGWSLNGKGGGSGAADPDITGMALQALVKYVNQDSVKTAVDKALSCLSGMQDSNGGFSSSWSESSSESVVQVLVGLCELGVSIDDSRFVKNGKTLTDKLLTYRNSDGSFKHTADSGGNNQMSTEQAFYGLVAALRAEEGKNSLYRMSDAINVGGTGSKPATGAGLPGKNADIRAMPVANPDMTFPDIGSHANRTAIEALSSRSIITGMDGGIFAPHRTMTRAEFAAIIVRGLGLTPKTNNSFGDVPSGQWYAPYIGTASDYGIVNGVGGNNFNPLGTITRQEAASMVAKAAKLCGMDTSMDDAAIRDMLAQFGDYITVDSWARESVAFCYSEDIMDQADLDILPKTAIKRCEIAQMVFNMLGKANLI